MEQNSVGDVVSSAASTATTALSVAAGELAKQAQAIGQLANAKDPIAWIAGEEDDDLEGPEPEPPEPLVPVPLAALRPWGVYWGGNMNDPFLDQSASEPVFTGGYGGDAAAARPSPPFEVDSAVNAKVILWEGDICALEVDALVAPSAAGYTSGASTVFPKITRYGGRDLRLELKHLDACRSGEARICKAYNLPARWLLLTVGPKYKEKYQVAAENTLNACYREVLQLMVESETRTVAIPCNWYAKGYPPEEQAHVALRTVRRCLENLRPSIDTVVIAAASAQEAELYESLMPLYFPRNAMEANAGIEVLPESCRNRWGEVTVEERRIRISPLISQDDRDDDDDGKIFSPTEDNDKAFLDAREDADDLARRRMECTMTEAEDESSQRAACYRYLRRAREIRPDPESTRFVYCAGQDQFKRYVIILLGARFPSLGVRDERTLPLFVKHLEALNGERFALLYVNSSVSALDSVCLEVLQEMLAVLGAKYRGTIDQLIVLHPGLWFRAAFALGSRVNDMAALIWNESIYAESFAELSRYLPVERLMLPDYVRAADMG